MLHARKADVEPARRGCGAQLGQRVAREFNDTGRARAAEGAVQGDKHTGCSRDPLRHLHLMRTIKKRHAVKLQKQMTKNKDYTSTGVT